MTKKPYCVFIGRFQPFHNAHLKLIENAFKKAEHVIIVVGSYRAPISLRNPWTYEERFTMIQNTLDPLYKNRYTIVPQRDFMYNDNNWITSLQNNIGKLTVDNKGSIIGHFKDDTSYYLNFFPQWELITQPNFYGIDATSIRESIYKNKDNWKKQVPEIIADRINRDIDHNPEKFTNLTNELNYIENYKKSWANSPFPPVFVTVDNVVTKSGHVLLVKRKINPGKGKYALPGGFIEQNETIFRAAIRELKEETEIDLPNIIIEKSLKNVHIFDHPLRSARGRTITHAHYFVLDPVGPLPEVKGNDDASEAVWVPLNDLQYLEENFFEDHIHIITHFVYNM